MKTLSAVIPTYYRYEPLESTVRDLLRQTVPPKQIIIVDNTGLIDRAKPAYLASTDKTECIYISSRCQAMVNVARNEGLKAVTADFAVLLDDDMSLPPDCVENLLQAHSEGWDAVTGVLTEADVLLESSNAGARRPLWDILRTKHGDFHCHTIAVPECLISMGVEMLERLNYLDEAFLYNYDDYDLGYRIWRGGYTLIHDDRVRAHHLKVPQGGSRKDLVGPKRRLNKYTAKYYFLSKHFSQPAVQIEFMTDIVFNVIDNGLRIDRTVREFFLQLKAFKGFRAYGAIPRSDSNRPQDNRPDMSLTSSCAPEERAVSASSARK